MATESFSRTFKVNGTWGVRNLEEAIDKGSDFWKMTTAPEAMAEFRKNSVITPEVEEGIRKAYGIE